jgi:GGDEF domain-containing protein
VLLEHIQRHPAEGEACCLALIDIDFFKQINDGMDTLPVMPCSRSWPVC